MADIFISYSRADRPRIEKLAAALESDGFDIWWDKRLAGGVEFSKETEAQLTEARIVLVAWSKDSIGSNWVADEASHGRDKSSLVPIAIDDVEPKLGFRQFQTIDFHKWDGAADAPAFQELRAALKARLTGEAPKFERAAAKAPWTEKILRPVPLSIAVAAFAVAAAIAAVALRGGEAPDKTTAAAAAEIDRSKSIAVLPFVALSTDQDDAFFGKGVAEELLNALAKFPELKVAARTSAFSFDGRDVDLREVGETLGVAHVLEGSVRRSGQRLRITAQLIRVSDGFHLWSETYERELTDIFEIQDEIVAELSRILQFRLGVGAGAGRAEDRNVDPNAYEEYLRGLDLWWRRWVSEDVRQEAILAFRRATVLDPEFADGWSAYGISMELSGLDDTPYLADEGQQAEEIRNALSKAIELDPNNVMAHAGMVLSDNSPASAALHLEKALALAPNAAIVNYAAGNHFFFIGDHAGAREAFDRAIVHDPLNNTIWRVRGTMLSAMGHYSDVEDGQKALAACAPGACKPHHGYAAFNGLIWAMMSGDRAEIRYWRDVFAVSAGGYGAKPHSARAMRVQIISKFVDAYLGEEADPEFWDSIDRFPNYDEEGMSPGLFASILAQHGKVEIALDGLLQYDVDYARMFTTTEELYPLLPGPFEAPEALRRHPRYHELWRKPGMAELAKIRRSNGFPHGLPLPIDTPNNQTRPE